MLKAPKFWYLKRDTYLSNSLYPFSLLFRLGTKIRSIISKEKISELPIICIGNIVVGGAGKTPTAIAIGQFLKKKGSAKLVLANKRLNKIMSRFFFIK